MTDEPVIMRGGLAVDDRGEVGLVNDFDFRDVKRFYTVRNHGLGFVRASHGHRRQEEYATLVSGAMLVCCVKIDNWDNPSASFPINRYILSDKMPTVLFIPPGYANGFMSLTENAKIMFFPHPLWMNL